MELVDMALFALFFDFVKNKTGKNNTISPLEASRVNLKHYLKVSFYLIYLVSKKYLIF